MEERDRRPDVAEVVMGLVDQAARKYLREPDGFDVEFPLLGGGNAALHVPRRLTQREFDKLLRLVSEMKDAFVGETVDSRVDAT